MRVALALSLILLAALPAAGEHELWYRYTVIGYVKDGAGRPLAGERLELVRDRTRLAYPGETDADGLYVIVARLGDESAGEALTLTHRRSSTKLTARFDPANHADERGTRVDIEAGRVVERAAWFRSTLTNAVGATTR